jgi:hypothetical protein
MQIERSCSFMDVTIMGDTFKKEIPGISSCKGSFTMEIINMQFFSDALNFAYKRLIPMIRDKITKRISLRRN